MLRNSRVFLHLCKNNFSVKNKISSEMSKNEMSQSESLVQRMTPLVHLGRIRKSHLSIQSLPFNFGSEVQSLDGQQNCKLLL